MPTGPEIEVKVISTPSVNRAQRKLRVVARRLKNPRVANKDVSAWLFGWVNDNFRSEGGKVGRWAPLAPSTIRRRRRGRGTGSPQILQDTGELRASFKPFFGRRFAGIGAGPHSMGRHIPQYHEFGTSRVPMRRMLPKDSDKDVIDGIIKIYNVYIRRAIKK